ncbi:MAG: HYC_CC_PP family protein [Janthinobacterium lividum]
MIKKSGIVLVVLLYLITATGFGMNLHFCGENIASISINQTAKDCGMSSKCCKTTHLEVKVKDAHQTAHTVFTGVNLALPVVVLQFRFQSKFSSLSDAPIAFVQRGPPPGNQPIFLKNCIFRI